MLNPNVLFNDFCAPLWFGLPAAHSSAINSGWHAVKNWHHFVVAISVGANAEIITPLIEKATSAAGANNETLYNTAIANTEVDDLYLYQVSTRALLDSANDNTHIKVTVTPGGAKLLSAVLFGVGPRIGAASLANQATKIHVVDILPGNLA